MPLWSHVFVINPSGIPTDNTYDYVTPTSHLESLSLHAFNPVVSGRLIRFGPVWSTQNHVRRTEHKSRSCKAADLPPIAIRPLQEIYLPSAKMAASQHCFLAFGSDILIKSFVLWPSHSIRKILSCLKSQNV